MENKNEGKKKRGGGPMRGMAPVEKQKILKEV